MTLDERERPGKRVGKKKSRGEGKGRWGREKEGKKGGQCKGGQIIPHQQFLDLLLISMYCFVNFCVYITSYNIHGHAFTPISHNRL